MSLCDEDYIPPSSESSISYDTEKSFETEQFNEEDVFRRKLFQSLSEIKDELLGILPKFCKNYSKSKLCDSVLINLNFFNNRKYFKSIFRYDLQNYCNIQF